MTWHVKKSINISDYGNILACGAIYSQNVLLKTFLILNDTIAARQHLVAKSELFGRLWFDPAIKSWPLFWNNTLKPCLNLSFGCFTPLLNSSKTFDEPCKLKNERSSRTLVLRPPQSSTRQTKSYQSSFELALTLDTLWSIHFRHVRQWSC